MSRSFSSAAAAAAVLLFAIRPAARAQLPVPSVSLAGGVSHYNLSGTSGTSALGAIRLDVPVLIAVVEGSVAVFRPREAGVTHTYVIPEAQLQWQLFPAVVRPYIGLGGGLIKSVGSSSISRSDLTLSAAAGVRVGIPLTPLGVRGEVRLRSIGGFSDHAAEFTLGASW